MKTAHQRTAQSESTGGILVATDGRELPLRGASLKIEAQGGIARTVLEQRFENPYDDPLAVTYLLPLPHDGAVSAFAFRVGERRVVGEVDRRAAARERFEQALAEGRSAALVEQDRPSLFTQEIGNIPPRAAVVAEITVDQRLAWLAEGAWELRFPTAVAPRYQGGPGRVGDAAKLSVPVAEQPIAPRLSLSLTVRDPIPAGLSPESPSHELHFTQSGGLLRASVRDESGAPLDRDLVVRWPAAEPAVGLSLAAARPEGHRPHADRAYGLLTLVPPRAASGMRAVPRDLIVLLDTSGSMDGEPLAQARRVVSAVIDSLTPEDRLELIEFSNEPRRWKKKPVEATEENRKAALAWLRGLQAGGGTEMRSGIFEAMKSLREGAQRQVVLVTDGLIGFESEVVGAILEELPAGSRLHTVGVGSAVNRSLTAPAARAGRGVEVVIGLGEDPERAARRLASRTAAPLVTEVEVHGSALIESAPARLPDLFAGAPALAALALRPEGGSLRVLGRTAEGRFEQRLEVRSTSPGEGSAAAVALFGREKVEDLEMRAAGGEAGEHDPAIEQIGLHFQIATRLTSWVAVSSEVDVDPTRPARREEMPHALPHGMSVEGLGLRSAAAPAAAPPAPLGASMARQRRPAAGPPLMKSMAAPASSAPPAPGGYAADASAKGGAPSRQEKLRIGPPSPSAPRREPELLEAEEPAPEYAALDVERGGAPALRGRLVLSKGRELVVEVAASAGPLPWDPPARARVVFEDGSELEVEVDLKRTTAATSLAPGQVARLALRLLSEARRGTPRRVLFELAGAEASIELG